VASPGSRPSPTPRSCASSRSRAIVDPVGARQVCRVVPDVAAIDRSFDYLVPDELARVARVGSIVRVDLHGRRVRGWIVALDVKAEVDAPRLRPLRSVSSEGPPPLVVELCSATAYRYAGSLASMLRAASPPNNVPPGSIVARAPAAAGPGLTGVDAATDELERAADELVAQASVPGEVVVLRWPPLADRRRLVAALVAAEGSTIVVVADAVRAVAFASWLRSRGVRVALLHSEASAADRTAAWADAARGGCVVVGGRMAAFAPLPDLSAVVILDDADEALQEERTPTWHARDVLIERAEAAGARVAVVSAMPTVAVRARATKLVAVPAAVEVEGWPRVEVVDLGAEAPGTGLLTEKLVDRVRGAVDGNDLALVVLNRRGTVRLLACRDCQQIARWDAEGRPGWAPPAADVAYLKPEFCPNCASTRLRAISVGVQRLGRDLAARLGEQVQVGVVDAATAVVLDVPVLVGTEAVLHRLEVRRRRPALVAFAEFDQELLAARYRAAEQALWLLVRAAHVLGARPRSQTRLLVQTSMPDHEVVRAVRAGAPEIAVRVEEERRATFGLPPFGALAEARGDEAAIERLAAELTRFDVASTGTVVLHDDHATLLVRAPDGVALAAALSLTLPKAREAGAARVAVDPPRV
jgi:primosomal protein N' (replication factor Y)